MDKHTVIPCSLRKTVLRTTSMKFHANQCVYWPGMGAAILHHHNACFNCIKNSPSQPSEPMILTRSPSYPLEKVCVDYFQIQGYSYLSVVDSFSGCLCIYSFKDSEVHSHRL